MDIQKRRTFIISFIYFGIIGVLCYIGLKKLLPILIPFMAAMAIAAMLEPAVSLLDRHMKGGKGAAAAVVLLVFYGSILFLICIQPLVQPFDAQILLLLFPFGEVLNHVASVPWSLDF